MIDGPTKFWFDLKLFFSLIKAFNKNLGEIILETAANLAFKAFPSIEEDSLISYTRVKIAQPRT